MVKIIIKLIILIFKFGGMYVYNLIQLFYFFFSKIFVKYVKLEEGLIKYNDQNKNYLCRLKFIENFLYSIKWGQFLLIIFEEDVDEYIVVIGYLIFYRLILRRKNMDEFMNIK